VIEGLVSDLYNALTSSDSSFSPVTIHLGGDEVVYGCWANDSSITGWMQTNGITTYNGLLGYFINNAQEITSVSAFFLWIHTYVCVCVFI
jgi:N-acetyl-beta-hexosaminidase